MGAPNELSFLPDDYLERKARRRTNAICAVLFFFIWARATFPRSRYDQLMRLGWKVFLPFSLLWVVVVAGMLLSFDALPK